MTSTAAAFAQPIRLAYLESRLFLDGEVYTKKLRQLGLSRASASADINLYLARYGQVMNYCPHRKRFILNRRFKPRLVPKHQMAAFARYVESIYSIAFKPLAKSVDL